jgi:hypothetical protein
VGTRLVLVAAAYRLREAPFRSSWGLLLLVTLHKAEIPFAKATSAIGSVSLAALSAISEEGCGISRKKSNLPRHVLPLLSLHFL